ncbi:MAG: hypothetical protein K6L76_10645 [Agarilytica sp.]
MEHATASRTSTDTRTTTPKNTAEIYDVVETFRSAIKTKNKESFFSLISEGEVPWIGIYDDDTLARGATLLPDHSKVWRDSPEGFIDKIVSTAHKIDERYWDLQIHMNGEIASVHFQYSFHINGHKQNWGEEAWQLIHIDGQWKITSVIYSITCH